MSEYSHQLKNYTKYSFTSLYSKGTAEIALFKNQTKPSSATLKQLLGYLYPYWESQLMSRKYLSAFHPISNTWGYKLLHKFSALRVFIIRSWFLHGLIKIHLAGCFSKAESATTMQFLMDNSFDPCSTKMKNPQFPHAIHSRAALSLLLERFFLKTNLKLSWCSLSPLLHGLSWWIIFSNHWLKIY